MKTIGKVLLGILAPAAAVLLAAAPVQAQDKPNILFIMGDDIGWMQPSIYHEGLAVGETPNIDRIGHEGAKFMTYYAEQSCTAGRNAFFTGMTSAAHRHDPAGNCRAARVTCAPVRRRLPSSCYDLGYTTGEFGKNHLGDHTESLPTAHGFQEFWGYLYHLDAMQRSASPTSTRPRRTRPSRHPARTRRCPVSPTLRARSIPRRRLCLTPPRPVIACAVV